jgi:ubiquitin-protein ligase
MSTVRLRRLHADFEQLSDYTLRHPRVNIVQAAGDPPERYQLEYQIRSLRQSVDEVTIVKQHLVEILLPRNYPRTPPQCRMLTPVFHPNIAPHAICVGDHWSAGESLTSIVIRIGEMLAFQSYNLKSPLNGEAAKWVEQHIEQLPVDEVCLLPDESQADIFAAGLAEGPSITAVAHDAPRHKQPETHPVSSSPVPGPHQPEPTAPSSVERVPCACPGCGKLYRVPSEYRGNWVRCKQCETRFQFE